MHSYEKVYEHPNVRPHVKLFDDFQITAKELSKFYDIFVLFDSNNNGIIEVDEFMKHLDITRTPFAYKVFLLMDEDSSGGVTFREFVLSIWNFCTLSNSSLERFAFDLYDKDGSAELTVEEIHQMLQDVYGTELQRNQHARRYILLYAIFLLLYSDSYLFHAVFLMHWKV
jgi:Ca2+-binding EF-hand superfamily protein